MAPPGRALETAVRIRHILTVASRGERRGGYTPGPPWRRGGLLGGRRRPPRRS